MTKADKLLDDVSNAIVDVYNRARPDGDLSDVTVYPADLEAARASISVAINAVAEVVRSRVDLWNSKLTDDQSCAMSLLEECEDIRDYILALKPVTGEILPTNFDMVSVKFEDVVARLKEEGRLSELITAEQWREKNLARMAPIEEMIRNAPPAMMGRQKIGEFVCPHQDGDYVLSVHDLEGWFSGACLVRQEGQGETHELVLEKSEAAKLATILMEFLR